MGEAQRVANVFCRGGFQTVGQWAAARPILERAPRSRDEGGFGVLSGDGDEFGKESGG